MLLFEVITMIFVGIDVAKDTHYAAVSDDSAAISSLKGVAWALWKRYSLSSKKSGSLLSRGEEPLYIHSNSPNYCTD